MYNGGSEWQNDTQAANAGLPDYYQTFNRNYDPALGKFIAVDPMAEGSESINVYNLLALNNNLVTPGKAAENFVIGGLGLIPELAPISVGYFLIDNFYPGGFEGAQIDFATRADSFIDHSNDPPAILLGIEDDPGFHR